MANAQTMRVIDSEPTPPTRPVGFHRAVAFPMRFVGRVWLEPNVDELTSSLGRVLAEAARPEQITEERVYEYCRAREIPHHHFEAAVLRAAFDVVDPGKVAAELARDLRSCIPSLISKPYACSADARDDQLLLHMGTNPQGEPGLAVDRNAPSWSVLPGYTLIEGTFEIEGTVRVPGDELRINAGWEVSSGTTCASFAAQAGSFFSPPLHAVVGWLAGTALRELSESIPKRLGTAIRERREPARLQVEKLLRMSGVRSKSRIHLMYWRRFRNYLIWSATA